MRLEERERPAAARRDPGGKDGFSLVEVTLALLVVAVGMTAAFALFPEALKNTRSAVDNTETALFADYVFSTLDLTAGYDSLLGNVRAAGLDEDADDFISISFSQDAPDRNFQIRKGTGKPHCFYWMPDYFGLGGGGEMSDNYFKGKLKTAAFTYTLDLLDKDGGGSPVVAVLKVWPGEYGDDISTKDLKDQDARIYYREILPPK